ncbi:MAG TPA: NADH-dependent [FeFe] hydrogenase, group A6 [Elusimicrobiales bacterium]|nr:NADH-dependent [FeFe] hydrogenase, group A6 [Elusimicrobiales bacterium]
MKLTVNGKTVEAQAGETLLTVLRREGVHVPTLCHMEGMLPTGACRICVVEMEGQANLVPSCSFPAAEGMKIITNSSKVVNARKTIIELLLGSHPDDCLYCAKQPSCELSKLSSDYGVRSRRFQVDKKKKPLDISSPSISRDPEKCILCGKCVRVCEEVQSVACIDFVRRGSDSFIGCAFDSSLNVSSCVNCGQCISVCPTGALTEKSDIQPVLDALSDKEKYVVVQHAPSISVSLAEEFGLPAGTDVNGLMTAAMRKMGFKAVFDTSFSADLTIMEEASELAHRVKNGGVLPMFTSCSPGWIKFIETFYPEMLPHLSTCKSPQQMLGAMIKTYYAKKQGLDPARIFSVSVMPCTAKKFEVTRPEMGRGGYSDIDAVLTTREFAQLLRIYGIDLKALRPEEPDLPFGDRSTAGKLFGASGGVMEAALRTAHFLLTGKELGTLKVEAVRGQAGHKEAKLKIGALEVGVAAVSGLGNARKLLEEIKNGRKDLHFIEVMTCPGGCINGGGQPIARNKAAVMERMRALYNIDATEKLRTSHANKAVQALYKDFLGKPLGEKSHHLLHTKYAKRKAADIV